MDQPALVEAVRTLTLAVDELRADLRAQQGVVNAIKKQGRDIRSTRWAVGIVAAVLVIAVAFTTGFGLLYRQVDRNQHELEAVQERTSAEILCPLYEFLALSLKVNPPPPGASAEQLELRRTAAETTSAGLGKLGCR